MTPRELAEEAREAFRRKPRGTAEEEIQRMVDSGLIQLLANGQVKVRPGMLFGDEGETEPKPRKAREKKKMSNKGLSEKICSMLAKTSDTPPGRMNNW